MGRRCFSLQKAAFAVLTVTFQEDWAGLHVHHAYQGCKPWLIHLEVVLPDCCCASEPLQLSMQSCLETSCGHGLLGRKRPMTWLVIASMQNLARVQHLGLMMQLVSRHESRTSLMEEKKLVLLKIRVICFTYAFVLQDPPGIS